MIINKNEGWTAKTIYSRVLVLCEQREWSITKLAEQAQLAPSTFYTYRYRNSIPSVETLIAICDAFGITLAKFFMVEDSETDELYEVLNGLSSTSKNLLKEVALRMRE